MKRALLLILLVPVIHHAYSQVKATTTEVNAGVDDTKFATALGLQGSKYLDQSGTKLYAVTAAGANTYTASVTPAITAYSAGQVFFVKITTANTGASTLNLNGLGAKTLVKDAATGLVAGDLLTSRIYAVAYDGTNFQLVNVTGAITGTNLNISGNGIAEGYGRFNGGLSLGAAPLTYARVYNNMSITGGDVAYGNLTKSTVQSDVTNTAYAYRSYIGTVADSSLVIDRLIHYHASQATIGVGTTVNRQYGFYAESSLNGAGSNYGFTGTIAIGPNNYNLYMPGTAQNRLTGNTSIGTFDNQGTLTVRPTANATKGAIFKRFSSTQSGNLSEWQDQAGGVLAYVSPSGTLSANKMIVSGIPATSAEPYSFLTRNDATGAVEKIKPTTLASFGITDGIQNQTTAIQSGGFKISGSGTLNSLLTTQPYPDTELSAAGNSWPVGIYVSDTYQHPFTENGWDADMNTVATLSRGASRGIQIAASRTSTVFKIRSLHTSNASTWRTLWHSGNLSSLSQLPTRNFTDLQNLPTTLAGYGITNAPTLTGSGATGTWGIAITGNAATANTLASARTINGVSFNGSANITVVDATAVHKTGDESIAGTKSFSSGVAIGGTLAAGYKLAVGGNIIAEAVKVKPQAQWPDYVFENDYPILSLPDVEKFILKNKHLPEVPSGAEVKKEGIDVGDMNARLLKKIEELTLYMIEKDKEMKKMSGEFEKLKQEVKSIKGKYKIESN